MIDELVAEQGVIFPRDPRELLGDFWPEDESIDDFLAGFPAVRREQVIAFLEEAKDRLLEAMFFSMNASIGDCPEISLDTR